MAATLASQTLVTKSPSAYEEIRFDRVKEIRILY